jgi:dipicolinate synthase subunit A
MAYVSEALSRTDEVIEIKQQEALEIMIKEGKYTHLLLPITGVDNKLSIRGCNIQLTEDLLLWMGNKTIITGLKNQALIECCQTYQIDLKTFMCEDFSIDNNYITCEGIIEKLVNLSDKAIYQSKILIVGYGKLGQICAKVLQPFQVTLYIAARSEKDLTKIKIDGFVPIRIESEMPLPEVDFVITTIPNQVISHEQLKKLTITGMVLDVSSSPYSLDHNYAEAHNLNVHLLPQVPGKIAPKSSGLLIAKYVSLL